MKCCARRWRGRHCMRAFVRLSYAHEWELLHASIDSKSPTKIGQYLDRLQIDRGRQGARY
ncbi:hypothetical protein BQ8482_350048 [Mesorhizobium delmotii]|uniref:Uncharacterized protein n=1 Tax=Mesorhizobium delmotii TaxID=1631247 RepID=A0A2P9AQF7_9HYPH|nr:hypothetical protein BQ8482_350048 [Mesorhizobium delmotii]